MADAAAADRDDTGEVQDEDIRPVVARKSASNLGLWLFLAALLIGGVWLFSVMSANRADIERVGLTATLPDSASRISSPPPLALPREFLVDPVEPRQVTVAPAPRVMPAPRPAPAPEPAQVRVVEVPR